MSTGTSELPDGWSAGGTADMAALLAGAPAADLYETITRRRDVRGQFTGEPVPADRLLRVLAAGHAAPSVGLTQPWDFVVVEDRATREAFWRHVQDERAAFAEKLSGERAAAFEAIKIEGVLESSLGVVVTYDATRGAPMVLGRNTIEDVGLFSVCLAIQNMWLAATAEGLGVGWVSFYREPVLRELLGIPEPVRPVAWLCVGPVTHLEASPDLERQRWARRRPLLDAVHWQRWA